MKRKIIAIFMAAAVFLTGAAPVFGAQAGGTVPVSLPNFKVTLNGETVNNDYSKYPLIVYKDVTYFPMTYSDCRFLGIESTWKGNKEGLLVEKTGVTAAFNSYKATVKNNRSYTAVVPKFPIAVNGKTVNNSKEEYPLLSFRDITYFPMTWKYSVEAFGWDYKFDSAKGLVINSDNRKLSQYPAPDDRDEEHEWSIYKGKLSNNVAVTDKHVYYLNRQGQIMQAALGDVSEKKAVYQLEHFDYGDPESYNPCILSGSGKKAMLYYHSGGATMGNEYTRQLNEDGTVTEINSTRTGKRVYGDKTFEWWVGPMPGPGNLTMAVGKGEPVQIGSLDILYGWHWNENPDGSGGGSGNRVIENYMNLGSNNGRGYLVGDSFYILGFNKKARDIAKESTSVYRVNIKTNDTERITKSLAVDFCIEGNNLYYTDGGAVNKIDLATGRETALGIVTQPPYGQVMFIEVLDGNVYCMNEGIKPAQALPPYEVRPHSIVRLSGNTENGQPERLLENGAEEFAVMGTGDRYMVCTYEENLNTRYRIAVYDEKGKLAFKTSDKAYLRNINIVGDTIYFYNITTGTVCSAQLK